MVRAWDAVYQRSIEEKTPLRIAAFVEGLSKVAEATRQRF
jgi:hypothetical protein